MPGPAAQRAAASATTISPHALIATYLNTRYTPAHAQQSLHNPPLLQRKFPTANAVPCPRDKGAPRCGCSCRLSPTLSSRAAAPRLLPSITPCDTPSCLHQLFRSPQCLGSSRSRFTRQFARPPASRRPPRTHFARVDDVLSFAYSRRASAHLQANGVACCPRSRVVPRGRLGAELPRLVRRVPHEARQRQRLHHCFCVLSKGS